MTAAGSKATITLIRKRTLNHLAKLAKSSIQNLKKELKIGIPISTWIDHTQDPQNTTATPVMLSEHPMCAQFKA